MKRIYILLLSAVAWSCSTLCAQKLTPQTEYYDYWETKVKSIYTVLPNGQLHGDDKRYDKSGTLRTTYQWDYGKLKSFVIHYMDKSPYVKGKVTYFGDMKFCTDYTSYNMDGSIETRYTMGLIPGSNNIYHQGGDGEISGVNFGELALKSFSNQRCSYTLSSDFKKATMKFKNGSHFVYDFEKEVLTILSGECSSYCADVFFNNGTLTFDKNDNYSEVYLCVEGFKYLISDGMSVKSQNSKFDIPMAKADFTRQFIKYITENDAFDMWIYRMNISESYKMSLNDCLSDDVVRELSDKHLHGLSVTLKDNDYLLKLTKGTKSDGEWEYTNPNGKEWVKITTAADSLSVLSFHFDDNGIITDYEGKIKMVEDCSYITFTNYLNSNGCRIVPGDVVTTSYANGDERIVATGTVGKYLYFDSGEIEIAGLKWRNADIVNFRYSLDTYEVRILRANGDQYQGTIQPQIANDLLNYPQAFPLSFKYVLSDVDNPQGTYTTASGDKFIGKFMDNASICNEFDPGKFIGEVEFRTASGKYIGHYKEGRVMGRGKFIHDNGDVYEGEFYDGVLNTNLEYYVSITFPGGERYEGDIVGGKFNGKGKLTMPNGDYYEGAFINNKFTGTGTVRATTSKGVYEGEVIDYQCVDNSIMKKIPAPKTPKFPKPNIVEKRIVK